MSIPKLVYKSQKVETQLFPSAGEWIGDVGVYSYNVVLFNHKKSEVLKHGFFRNIVLSKRS